MVKRIAEAILKTVFRIESSYEHYFIKCLGNNPTVVDLGAGMGDFSSNILKIYPLCNLVLIEPNPYLIQDLTQRFRDNAKLKILHAVIGNTPKNEISFYLKKDWGASSLYRSLGSPDDDLRENESEVRVRMVNLEDIFLSFNLRQIDILKIDIEGAEWDLLEHFSKHDFERIPQISVEFHDFLNPLLRKRSELCIKKLRSFGYSFIHQGSTLSYGSPYINCLFYDKKRIPGINIMKWRLSNILVNNIANLGHF